MAHLHPALFTFLDDLAANNDRDWFKANQARYETEVKKPALDFIADFGPHLADVSPHFLAIPKATGGSLFRIYRDTRFSKDKTPYKTHVAMQFRHELAERDVHAPGFYLHLAPGATSVGAGIWRPPNPVLNRIRDAVVAQADRWTSIRADLQAAGWTMLDGDGDLKRVPRGYDADHVHADDLRRKSFAASVRFDDEDVWDEAFADRVAERYAEGGPLVQFLCEALDLPW